MHFTPLRGWDICKALSEVIRDHDLEFQFELNSSEQIMHSHHLGARSVSQSILPPLDREAILFSSGYKTFMVMVVATNAMVLASDIEYQFRLNTKALSSSTCRSRCRWIASVLSNAVCLHEFRIIRNFFLNLERLLAPSQLVLEVTEKTHDIQTTNQRAIHPQLGECWPICKFLQPLSHIVVRKNIEESVFDGVFTK